MIENIPSKINDQIVIYFTRRSDGLAKMAGHHVQIQWHRRRHNVPVANVNLIRLYVAANASDGTMKPARKLLESDLTKTRCHQCANNKN